MPDSHTDPVRHITVDTTPLEDDELIEIGAPQSASPAEELVEVSWEDEEAPSSNGFDSSSREEAAYDAARDRGDARDWYGDDADADDEMPDYSLDDLKPMPAMQKVILIVLIAVVVLAAVWIFEHVGLNALLGA